MITALICALTGVGALQTPAAKPVEPKAVTLSRVSKANEKLAYDVKSNLQVESRQIGLQTWIPEDLDLSYQFTTQVTEVKPDGIVVIHYLRPTMTEVQGETADTPPKERTEKLNLNFMITITPINEIVTEKDLSPEKGSGGKGTELSHLSAIGFPAQTDVIGQYVGEIYRLALNFGSFDSALDFAPKLPLDEVKAGDTWKHTVGYSPQKLKDKAKSVVQRLDYTYTYQGIVDSGDKKVYRVTADLDLNTNLADFLNEAIKQSGEDSILKSIMLNLKTHIDFDLDLNTRQTLRAVSQSTGGFNITLTTHPDQPLHEERFKGTTTMRLMGRA